MPRIESTKYKIQSTKSDTSKPSLRDAVIADIHAKNIRPRPRWQYILLHFGLWVSGIVTILLGSFAFALMMLEFSLPERAYFRWMEMHDTSGWFLALPYLWGIGMIFALTLGYLIFSRTGRSYRLHAGAIGGILVLGSLLGGEILYATHVAHFGDRQMQRFSPPYRNLRQGFTRMMPRPEDGILPLRVTSIAADTLHGQTPDGQEWVVTLRCGSDDCEQKRARISIGKPAIFEGELLQGGVFAASEVFFPEPGMLKNPRRRSMIRPQPPESDHGSIKKGA